MKKSAIKLHPSRPTLAPYRGFTLIEIMVAMVIVGIVFGAIITSAGAIQRSSRDAKRLADLKTIQGALQQFYADNNQYPDSLNLANISRFSSGGKIYLNNVPKEPVSGRSVYIYVPSRNASCGGNCSCSLNNANIDNRCYFYILCADLENNPSSSPSRCSPPYDLEVTP